MIGQRFNMDNVFLRDLTTCVLFNLEGQLRWTNKFTSGDVNVEVPFYYSLAGDERFLLDSFQDDIVGNNRFIELNTDIVPRGHVTLKSFNIDSDEMANPNIWLKTVIENDVDVKRTLKKVRAIPITVTYDVNILLESEIDVFKCSQSLMDALWIYRFMYFEHNFMNIDAVMLMSDSNSVEISRDKNLSSDNKITMSVPITVKTFYPAYEKDLNSGDYNPRTSIDPYDYIGKRPEDPTKEAEPRRSKWYSNIIKSRNNK